MSDKNQPWQEAFQALKQHVGEQDLEIYRQSQAIRALEVQMKQLNGRLEQLGDGAGPANEKPPHY